MAQLAICNPSGVPLKNLPQLVHLVPPSDYEPRETLSAAVWTHLRELLFGLLTDAERAEVEQELPDSALSQSIQSKLHALIISQVATSWHLLTRCDQVMNQLAGWSLDADGLGKIDAFHKEWKRFARIQQRKEKAPSDDPTVYPFREKTVPQLRRVLRRLRGWRAVTRDVTDDKLIAEFGEIVREDATLFHLRENLSSFQSFFRERPDSFTKAVDSPRAAVLFNEWYAWKCDWQGGNSAKKMGDKISSLAAVAKALYVPRLPA